MNVYWISSAGIEAHAPAGVPALLRRDTGFVWVDIPHADEAACQLLQDAFGFHPLAVRACRERSHVPKLHAYTDHAFVILNSPEVGHAGHVHLLELDQFIGRRYLVTVHGPFGEGVAVEAALERSETRAVLQRMEAGRFRPAGPAELSYTLVSGLTRQMEALIASLARQIAVLERQTLTGQLGDPERALEAMFTLRHELLTVQTLATQSRVIYARLARLAPRFAATEAQAHFEDIAQQFEAIQHICEGEGQYLRGVIEFYESRTVTKLNLAMERLALITVLLLPITAIASIYGMNIIVSDQTDVRHVLVVLLAIGVTTGLIALWAKRRGWW
jgi:Mg2+ and Co2+ transporter CorA